MAKNDQGWNQWWAQVGISRPSLCTPPCDPPSVEAIAHYHKMPGETDTINKLIMHSKALTQEEAGGEQPGLNTIERGRRAARLADYRDSRDMLNKLLRPIIEEFEKPLKKKKKSKKKDAAPAAEEAGGAEPAAAAAAPTGGGTSQRKTKRRKSKRKLFEYFL